MTRPGAASTVIKVGGRAQHDPRLAVALAAFWAQWRTRLASGEGAICCVVHGGGDEVTALQRAAGIEPTFIGGRRVTRPEDIDRLRMALSGLANKRLVSALTQHGVRAVGLSGEDGPLLTADLLAGGELGAVGTVRRVDTSLLAALVAGGYLPIIAPVAAARTPKSSAAWPDSLADSALTALNINGDDAAAAIARATRATELLLISDVEGVRVDGELVEHVTSHQAERAIARGEITGGMVAKVRAALSLVDSSAIRVRIGSAAVLTGTVSGTLVGPQGATHEDTGHGHREAVA
jgi:acetylglutamate kinase